MKNENKNKNLKLYPKYRQLAMDLLFFYTINVLFLTQIKQIAISAVVLVDTFYALFVIICQIPGAIIVEKIGRKKSIILGNLCNAIYLIIVINATGFISLVFAEVFCAMAFALKDVAEPALLNDSINYEKEEKSNIFAKIQGKAVSGYYVLSAVSLILSGILYEINGYIPICLSLGIVIIALLMSTRFEEPKNKTETYEEMEEVSLKEAIKFCIQSKRCRCILIFEGIIYATIAVLATYEISLLESLNISSVFIGIIFALLNIVSSLASKKQQIFQEKFKNRTLTVLGLSLSISCIIAGAITYAKINIVFIITIILIMYIIKYMMVGLYNVLLIKYLSNFTNEKIDTKIFAIDNLSASLLSVIFGIIGSGLLEIMTISKAMIVFSIFVLIIISITLLYMKNKVGLNPNEYSELDLKYDKKVK